MKPTALLRTLPFAALLFSACRDTNAVNYRVPKEVAAAPAPAGPASEGKLPASHPAPGASGAAMADATVATATGNALTWTAPSTWQAKAASSMRKGTYTIAGVGETTADLAITAFPGDVGGEVANVNRWRGQVGLAPLPDAAVPAAITRLEVNGLKIAVVDLGGGGPTRLIGAMVPLGGATWFFKLLGPDALVAQEKPAFLQFLQSIRSAAPTI